MSVTELAAELGREGFRPLRRHEYDQLTELGLFDDERIELLAGVLVQMVAEGPVHSGVIEYLDRLLARGLPERLSVRIGHPYAATDISEPEPDLAVVPLRHPRREHPSDALVVIEVAVSSRRRDLRLKAAIYAEAGVPEYWVVDLVKQVVHVHADIRDGRYTTVTTHGRDETLSVCGVAVPLADVLVEPS